MSCLSVDVKLLRNPLVLSTERIGGISANVSLASVPLVFKVADITKHLSVAKVADITKHLSVRCSIVCSIKDEIDAYDYRVGYPRQLEF